VESGIPHQQNRGVGRDAAVLVATTASVDGHDTGDWHPERVSRLHAIDGALQDADLGDAVAGFTGRVATPTELARAHGAAYLDAVAHLAEAGGGSLDPDTPVSAGSWSTACWAAGTALAAVDALESGTADAAFVAVRPPGHHATRSQAMGFCLVNNVAVVAATLADRGERVAIVDWDVHHGNGTQEIFWDDPRVLYTSVHQWPAYPGSGRVTELGGPHAPGLTLNVPLPPGATGDVALAAFDEVIGPAVATFVPTWVLVSAGFDAHRADPLADLAWSSGDFALLAGRVQAVAPPGRLIGVLEGGYDLDALGHSVAATVAALAGVRGARYEEPTSGGPGFAAVAAAARARALLVEGTT